MKTPASLPFPFFFGTLSLAALIALQGCATPPTPTQPISKIAELQNRTQSTASSFKKAHPQSDATYIAVRSKYRDAAAKSRGFLAALQAGVINQEKNFDTPGYRQIALEAEKATAAFVELAEKNTPADNERLGVGPGAAIIAGVLVQAGIDIWKASVQIAAEKAKAVADSLKQYEWPDWEKL